MSTAGRLQGKVGLIVGAAGGIGAAAARAFAGEGAVLGVLDRSGDALESLAADLGPATRAITLDVTDESSVQRAMQVWAADHDRTDFVYLCAGVQEHNADGPPERVSIETWRHTIDTNLTGAFLCVKHSLPLLRAAPAGSLILCGSPTGLTMSGAGYTAYAASKAGMMSLARTVAADHAADGVRANVIVPGTTQTPLIEPLLVQPETRLALERGTPIGRIGTPADLTGIAVFLASDESRYATGATFCVDGGLTAR